MQRVLVTGAKGQIGTDLVAELHSQVTCHVIASDIKPAENGQIAYTRLDVTDRNAIRTAVVENEIEIIFHLASILSAKGERNPDFAWRINVEGLRNVLDVSQELGVRVFWPSSIAAFGPGLPEGTAVQNSPRMPGTMYGVTKVAGELLCGYYHGHYGLDVRSLRYPGIISHRALPGGGTTDYAVEIFHAMAKGEPYTCFLKEDATLPMMHMDDAIRASIELMDADPSRLTQRTSYNLAAISFSPAELTEAIARHVPDFTCRYEPDYRQEIAESWPAYIDDSVARTDWDWQHRYDLDKLVLDMLEHLAPQLIG